MGLKGLFDGIWCRNLCWSSQTLHKCWSAAKQSIFHSSLTGYHHSNSHCLDVHEPSCKGYWTKVTRLVLRAAHSARLEKELAPCPIFQSNTNTSRIILWSKIEFQAEIERLKIAAFDTHQIAQRWFQCWSSADHQISSTRNILIIIDHQLEIFW